MIKHTLEAALVLFVVVAVLFAGAGLGCAVFKDCGPAFRGELRP